MRFLLATGWGAAIDPAEARARGVEAVLAKPYHPHDLLHALADQNTRRLTTSPTPNLSPAEAKLPTGDTP